MDENSKTQVSMQKMIDGIKLAVFLSLANNAFEVYKFVNEPSGFRNAISIALGIIATLLIWQFSRALQAEKRQALYYWLVLVSIGYIRWILIDASFSLNIVSTILMLLTVAFTLRIAFWVRNKSLT